MIESFKHKGLQDRFENGSSTKVQKALTARARRPLDATDIAKTPEALNVPGFGFHGLQGKPTRYGVYVNGPWCITFEWQGENAMKLDLENYHQQWMLRKRLPTHPWAILREDVRPNLPGISVSALVRSLGISRQTLHSVLAERSGVSAEMALRLGTFLGNGAQLWLDMQTKFDLWQAEARIHDELGQIKPLERSALAWLARICQSPPCKLQNQ